jgi:hypothetical protein
MTGYADNAYIITLQWLATIPQTHIHIRLNPATQLTEVSCLFAVSRHIS